MGPIASSLLGWSL